MPYYCLECKKTHANGYKKHLKYKSQALVIKKHKPTDLEKMQADIREIKKLLASWSMYIQRKHPYWKVDKDFTDWVNDV